MQPMRPRSAGRVPLALVAVIAGLMLGAGVIAVLALTGVFSSDVGSPHAEDELLAAYQRSRTRPTRSRERSAAP